MNSIISLEQECRYMLEKEEYDGIKSFLIQKKAPHMKMKSYYFTFENEEKVSGNMTLKIRFEKEIPYLYLKIRNGTNIITGIQEKTEYKKRQNTEKE